MTLSELRRLKALEEENTRRIVAQQVLDLPDSGRVWKILRKESSRRDWTIKGKGRKSLIVGGTKNGGNP